MSHARWDGLRVRDEGPRDDPTPVVLVHSLGGSSAMWDGVVVALGSRRTLRWDAREHGDSGATAAASPPFSIAQNASDGLALLDHHGIGRAHLVGISMGALTVIRMARARPQRVCSVTLANSSVGGRPDAVARLASLRDAIARQGYPSFSLGYVRSRLADSTPDAVARRYLDDVMRLGPDGYLRAMASILAENLTGSWCWPAVPVQVLVGDQDRSTPLADAERLAACFPAARLQVLQASGHFSCLDQPIAFAAALETFLHDVQTGPESPLSA